MRNLFNGVPASRTVPNSFINLDDFNTALETSLWLVNMAQYRNTIVVIFCSHLAGYRPLV